jgi:hypothetical protein
MSWEALNTAWGSGKPPLRKQISNGDMKDKQEITQNKEVVKQFQKGDCDYES